MYVTESVKEGFSSIFLDEVCRCSSTMHQPICNYQQVQRDVTVHYPKRVFGNNRASVSVEMETGGYEEKMDVIKDVDRLPWRVMSHQRYNDSKRLRYVHKYDLENLEELKAGLQAKIYCDRCLTC